MDALDIRVIRCFFQNQTLAPLNPDFRESVAAIARKIGMDEDTVRHRLRKIQASGLIREWRLFVNPRLWGGGELSVALDIDPAASKEDLVEQLRLVPGVIFISACYDSLVACVEYENEMVLPRTLELIRRLSGAPDLWVRKNAFPECTAVLRARDWDLIQALRRNPLKPCAALAAEVGLSNRTTKLRLSKIAAQGVIFAWPSLNLRAVEGGAVVHLNAEYPAERKREIDESIVAHVEPYLWHILHMLPYRCGETWACGYDLIVPNLAVAREILDWAKDVPGIGKTRLFLYEDIFNFLDSYEALLDRNLRRMAAGVQVARVHESRKRVALLEHG